MRSGGDRWVSASTVSLGVPTCWTSRLLEASKEACKLGEERALILSPVSLQVTLTSLDIPFAMFAPKNLELEDADPMVSPPLTKVTSETGGVVILPGLVTVPPQTVSHAPQLTHLQPAAGPFKTHDYELAASARY